MYSLYVCVKYRKIYLLPFKCIKRDNLKLTFLKKTAKILLRHFKFYTALNKLN